MRSMGVRSWIASETPSQQAGRLVPGDRVAPFGAEQLSDAGRSRGRFRAAKQLCLRPRVSRLFGGESGREERARYALLCT